MSDLTRTHPHITCGLLLAWQSSADVKDLESLIDGTRSLIERTARATLRRHHIGDPAAVDEAVSLVLDHLRRLPGASPSERHVSPFVCRDAGNATDLGESYLTWLATERARDVARHQRRYDRRLHDLAHRGSTSQSVGEITATIARSDAPDDPEDSDTVRVEQAIGRLDPRLAAVVRMLLAGTPQNVIATQFHVCEGTVSRLRTRAISMLRQLVTDEPDGVS